MYIAVKSTKIFCNDRCPAQPPLPSNRISLPRIRDCLGFGCRPCKRCRPMHIQGGPDWLQPLFDLTEESVKNTHTIGDQELKTLGLTKPFLGRWFAAHHQLSFESYVNARRLAQEMGTHSCDKNTTDFVGRKKVFQSLIQRKSPALLNRDVEQFILCNRLLTPLGPMVVCANDQGICMLEFTDRRMLETQLLRIAKLFRARFRIGCNAAIRQLAEELGEYFSGKRIQFDVNLMDMSTDFQNSVWEQLKSIPLGETSTYQELAVRLNKPTAVRAVGRANGDNRISILIPCHRLIGSDGSLTGYGGGLDRKKWLLEHEQRVVPHAMSKGASSRAK